jgi:hypothetical protein
MRPTSSIRSVQDLNQINSVMLASKDIGATRAILSVPSGFIELSLRNRFLRPQSNPQYESFATGNSKVLRLVQARETAQALRTAQKFGPIASVNDWIFKYFNDSLYKGVCSTRRTRQRETASYEHSVAVKVADAVVEKSQGIFEDALKPAAISSHHPLLQLAAPLQTAVMNTFNVLKNDVVFAKLTPDGESSCGRPHGSHRRSDERDDSVEPQARSLSPPDAIPFFRLAQLGIGGDLLSSGGAGPRSLGAVRLQQALLMTPQMRKLGGLQTMKTVSRARNNYSRATR